MKVGYEVIGGSARARADFAPDRGTLVFNPGEAKRSFAVRLVNDSRPERLETIRVRLRNAPDGVRTMTPTVRTIAIRASDQLPDAQLSRTRRRGYVGNDAYNNTGRHQQRVAKVRRGRSATHFVRIQNDGTARSVFTVRRATKPTGVRIRFHSGGRGVTRAMGSRAGWRVSVRPDHSRVLRMRASVGRRAGVGSVRRVKVVVQWQGDRRRNDAVKSVLRVVR
jgi:hypothetical protein